MPKYEIRAATREQIEEIAANIREDDRREIWASSHRTPLQAILTTALVSRDTFVGLADGRPFCVFGVAEGTVLDDEAAPWLIGTDELPKHAKVFLRLNRIYVKEIKKRYSLLANFVDARNTTAIRWLRWLGFTILPAEPHGPDKLPFHRFEMRNV